jgi:hypothetical protein
MDGAGAGRLSPDERAELDHLDPARFFSAEALFQTGALAQDSRHSLLGSASPALPYFFLARRFRYQQERTWMNMRIDETSRR